MDFNVTKIFQITVVYPKIWIINQSGEDVDNLIIIIITIVNCKKYLSM